MTGFPKEESRERNSAHIVQIAAQSRHFSTHPTWSAFAIRMHSEAHQLQARMQERQASIAFSVVSFFITVHFNEESVY